MAQSTKNLSWKDLNALLADAEEKDCQQLLASEKKGARRKQYMLRIHSRLNKVRADRERDELILLAE